MKTKQILKAGFSLAAMMMLAACATKSNVRADGTTDKPVFPKPFSVTFNNDRGTFPTQDELDNYNYKIMKENLGKKLEPLLEL